MSVRFRTANQSDLPLFSDWAANEGWNPGLDDMAAFHAADPQGFFVAELDGQSVAAISVVNHSDSFAFLGLYLCQPAFRGQGIGFGLWKHALSHAGGRTVGLDGVADQQANYAKSGFVRHGASVRFAGPLGARPDPRVRPVAPDDKPTLRHLDKMATGASRPAFLRAWITDTPTRRTFVLDDGTGFATIRRCREGVKFGPIVAQDARDALVLMRAGLAELPSDQVFVDLPDTSKDLAHALTGLGYSPTFETARMYRHKAPSASGLQQAIGTMELG